MPARLSSAHDLTSSSHQPAMLLPPIPHQIVFLGVAVQLVGLRSYISGSLRGTTTPNRVTWLMWAIAPLIGVAAAISDGVTWEVVPVLMSGVGPLLIFAASFVNTDSYWKLERFDVWCGVLSVIALVSWGVTRIPEVA